VQLCANIFAVSSARKLFPPTQQAMTFLRILFSSTWHWLVQFFLSLHSANFSPEHFYLPATALYNFIAYPINPFAATRDLTQCIHRPLHVYAMTIMHILETELRQKYATRVY